MFGFFEHDNEDNELRKTKTTADVFESNLGNSATSLKTINRIGRKKSGSCRSVIRRLFNYNENQAILNHSEKLKCSNLSISSDYTKDTVEK